MIQLHRGDKVAIVAPCGQIENIEKISLGLEYLKSLGLEPILSQHLLSTHRYMAGTDQERAADINAAYADTDIKALFCVRAAAGGTRILPYIDYQLAAANPKPVIGFCDNVALQIALAEKANITSLNGFNLTYDFRSSSLDSQIKSDLENLLFGQTPTFISGIPLRTGICQGTLIATNLSVLMRMAGTAYFPNLKNKILLLEDTHERLHKIDLMLQQLKQQPDFDKISGIIFGQFTDCSGDTEDGSLEDCFIDFMADTDFPILKDFNFGHLPSRRVLPLGVTAELNTTHAELKLI